MKNVYLFQPQYSVDVHKETNYWLPYSVGCLWAYAQQFSDITENFQLSDMFFKRDPVPAVIESINNPQLCGFSVYIWNEKYCLALAKQIKMIWPDCIIVFGGPQTSARHLNQTFVDSIILGEGEERFVDILRAINNGTTIEKIYTKSRLDNLNIPSPYRLGLFNKMIKDNPDAVWAMTLETNRGCPYACTFCDWGSVTYSKVKKFDVEHVADDLAWAAVNPVSYIFCADANFGILKERDLTIAKLIRDTANKGRLESVNIQYAKNSTDIIFEIAKTLGNLTRGITISVQSMNPDTLEVIKRKNLQINDIKEFLTYGQQYNIGTYTEIILGLPLETLKSWRQGVCEILEMGQHDSIDVWFCQLLENSELNSFDSKLRYKIKTILAHDFMPYNNSTESKEVIEEIMIINETSTMSTEEMVDAYLYSWLVIQFHISGYSQLYAKYARYILNISYQDYYDQLTKLVIEHAIFGQHYTEFKQSVSDYLTTGKLSKGKGHGLGSDSFKFFYELKEQAIELAKTCLEHFGTAPEILSDLQQNFVYDQTQQYPIQINSPWDVLTWVDKPSKYTINQKGQITDDFNFYFYRRKGLLKNLFVKE
jgi:radical SAM superfamily enzyme YgiQ (UPF0313 family)